MIIETTRKQHRLFRKHWNAWIRFLCFSTVIFYRLSTIVVIFTIFYKNNRQTLMYIISIPIMYLIALGRRQHRQTEFECWEGGCHKSETGAHQTILEHTNVGVFGRFIHSSDLTLILHCQYLRSRPVRSNAAAAESWQGAKHQRIRQTGRHLRRAHHTQCQEEKL